MPSLRTPFHRQIGQGLVAAVVVLTVGLSRSSHVFAQAKAASAIRFAPVAEAIASDSEGSAIEVAPATTPDGTATAAATEPAKDAESERSKRLKTLDYDRRPSTILAVWSKLNRKDAGDESRPEDEATKEESAEEPPAEPADPKAAVEAKRKAEEKQQLDAELETLQRKVTLGKWADVKTYWAGLPKDEAQAGYAQMVQSLGAPKPPDGVDPQMAQMTLPGIGKITEANVFDLPDVIGLIDACPHERDEKTFATFAPIVALAMQRGLMEDALVEFLTALTKAPKGEPRLTRREATWLLRDSGRIARLEPFLPTFDEAREAKDVESLTLLAQCRLAEYQQERRTELLERSWEILQAACFVEEAKEELRADALARMLALVPRVRDDLGLVWLERTFREDPEFGVRILESVGKSASTAMQSNPVDPSSRLGNLKLQRTVVESLLEKSPERAEEWNETLRLLADVWVKEAEFSRLRDRTSSRGPRMQRDVYGNLFYMDENDWSGTMSSSGQQEPQPIAAAEILKLAPGEAWEARLDDDLKPKVVALHAQLRLKVGEEEEAFPYIERLAPDQPDLARNLVHQFLRVWTTNHDPNSSQEYTSPYMWMYGFEEKASGIPLTRSKQVRNLAELTKWVARIRALGLEKVDESLVARAFTTCHSSAEVYELADIERVLGSIGELDSKTLAQLVEQMRGNLAGVWRSPAEQEQARTQRKKQDIAAEVMRGYAVAAAVVNGGLAKHPDDWRLLLVGARLKLDELMYRNDLEASSEFSERRNAVLDEYRRAAEAYAAAVPELDKDEQTIDPYVYWFYAGLGASDAGQIDHEATPDSRQPKRIREALAALPGEAAETHRDMFANSLFTRMSAIEPAVKFRYLEAGFEIVGDHEKAAEAKDVYDYYQDLVTEIRLVARVDGSPRVGHAEPFGVFVELHHTREIERESGGFAKYLQNQQNAMWSYNYGRPLENYRDKFEEGVRAALGEHFDVHSVTYYDAKEIRSLATEEYGWRNTPYAYVLLEPKSPKVDKIPAMKIDLDFLDTSGYVVLPITSAPLAIDAATERPDARPREKIELTQILDERESDEGRLRLEVKATARGLVPPLDELLDVRASDFEVGEIADEGVLVSKFDADTGGPSIISERTWTIDYTGRTDLAALPTTFAFPEPRGEPAEVSYLRYEDADLAEVPATVDLEREYGRVRSVWPWVLGIGAFLLIAGLLAVRAFLGREREPEDDGIALPEPLTPFNVLALLRGIERRNGFDPATRTALASNIATLERQHFADEADGDESLDLRSIAVRWATERSRNGDHAPR